MAPIVAAAIAALLFAQGFVRLRRRGRADLAGWDRAALFGLGLSITVFALVGPLDRLADDTLLSAHMAQHVLIGDLGPALMTFAVRGPLLVFLLPASVLAPIARSTGVRAALAVLLRPRVAFGLWTANLAIWHVPYLYDLALRHQPLPAGQVLTDVLVFSFHSFYPAYNDVRDQQWAGLVMMGEQLLTLGTLAVVLLRPRLHRARLVAA